MEYLRNSENIGLPPGTQLFEGSSEKDLLNVRFLGFGVKTAGNIDVVLASSRHQSTATIRQNILGGIELKKDTNTEHAKIERQVVLQHLAASYLNPTTGILTMMTDLKNRWHFFWFAQGKRLKRYEATRSEALFLMQHSLDEQGSVSTPSFFLNRACWNGLFPSPDLGSIAEEYSFDEENEKDADSYRGKDSKGGEETLSETGGRNNPQYGKSRRSGQERTSGTYRQGKSKASNCGREYRARMVDASLDFMDEEEKHEAAFRMALQTSFHRMVYVPEVEER